MAKPRSILIISGVLVIIGIILSYSQSSNELNNIATVQKTLPIGGSMNVSMSLDPAKSTDGVYSISITDFKEGDNLSFLVNDPNEIPFVSKTITKSPFQENFTINTSGTYELKIDNTSHREMQVLGIIGYYPHGPTFVDVLTVILLIAGLSGLAIGMMYFIKRKGKGI